MRWEKDFALRREIITIIAWAQPLIVKLVDGKNPIVLKLESFLDKADFEGCEKWMRKSIITGRCGYYYELMRRGDDYSWNL